MRTLSNPDAVGDNKRWLRIAGQKKRASQSVMNALKRHDLELLTRFTPPRDTK